MTKQAFASVRRLAIRKRQPQEYPDSEKGVKQFLLDNINGYKSERDLLKVDMAPDPQVEDVWLAVDHKRQIAFVIYLAGEGSFMNGPSEPDFEEIEYDSAAQQLKNLRW